MYCIYQIVNIINNKKYIGQHKYEDESNPMGRYRGSGKILHLAYDKYGIENFETKILYKRIRDKETANAMEIWAIESYKPEYNIAKGGDGVALFGEENGFYGKHHSEKTKAIIGEKSKGRKHSEETKKKISESMKNKKFSDSHRENISISAKNRKEYHHSDQWKRKMSESLKGKQKHNLGKHWKLVDGKRVWYKEEK